MENKKQYYIVEEQALPVVIQKVLQAKCLMETSQAKTIQEAVEAVGISRSAFYKYKDAVFPFYENSRGKTVTFAMNLYDGTGYLSHVLNTIARSKANVLTINQTIPVNNIANVTISIETGQMANDIALLFEELEKSQGVQSIKIIARE